MKTPAEVGNSRAGLQRIINDLQNEHSRYQVRLERLEKAPLQDEATMVARRTVGVTLEYLELLIRRYRGWLHD